MSLPHQSSSEPPDEERRKGQSDFKVNSKEIKTRSLVKRINQNLNVGIQNLRQGRFTIATECFQEVLQLQSNHPRAHYLLGVIAIKQRHYSEGIHWIRRAIELNPNTATFYRALGDACMAQGHLEEAIAAYRSAIEYKPDVPALHYHLGMAYKAQGNSSAAVDAYQRAIELKPDYCSAYNSLGLTYYEQGKLGQAITTYHQAISYDPYAADTYYKLGIAYKAQGKLEAAITAYQKTIELNASYYQAHNNLGNIYREQGKLREAIAAFEQAIQLHQNYHQAYNNLGFAYYAQGKLDKAIAVYRQAISCKEDFPDAYYNLGIAYHDQGKIKQAIASYQQAIALKLDYPEALYNLSLCLLLSGDLINGWQHYKWRFQRKENAISSPKSTPMWQGTSVGTETILLWSEQGLGDAIQFIRYGLILMEQGYSVAIATYPALIRLFQNCLIAKLDVVNQYEVDVSRYRHHASLMSLPRILQTTMATIPENIPYLQSVNEVPISLRLPDSPEMKIGVVWGSAINNPHLYRKKSIPVDLFLKPYEDFLRSGELSLWSLQVGEDAHQIDPWLIDENVHDLSSQLKDFEDTAGVIDQLDLVITVDTAVAHLAGAMGKPVWVLLPFVPDWRWLLTRQDSPWYPSMRLFRQRKPGDWQTVLDQIKKKIRVVLDGDERPIFPLIKQDQTQFSLAFTNSSDIDAHFNLGNQYKKQEKLTQALDAYQKVIERKPNHIQAHYNMGNVYRVQGNLEAAIASYQQVIALNPSYYQAHNNLGFVYYAQGKLEQAILAYRQAISCNPDAPDAYYNLGIAYKDQGKLNEAIACYLQAIELKNDYYQAHHNLGCVYHELGQCQDAIAAFQQAIALHPHYPEAYFNLACSLLLTGNLENGLKYYEWRFQRPHNPIQSPLATPRWQGGPIEDNHLLVWSEQGLGDTIQFVRYVKLLIQRGVNVTIATRSPLIRLFQNCLHPTVDVINQRKADLSPYHSHASMMSLPYIMETTLATIPNFVPYIHTTDRIPAPLNLPETGSLKVGVVWASAAENHQLYQKKTIPVDLFLQSFEDLLKLDQLSIWSLQVGQDSDQIQPWLKYDNVNDLSPRLKDFADTAAIIAQLDLVISVDTAVAHLAGAMNKPVWVLLPFTPDWRWLLSHHDSPWYPSMRLFRQPQPGDWPSVLQQVQRKLQHAVHTPGDIDNMANKESSLDPVIKTDGFNAVVQAKHGYMAYNQNDIYIGRSIEKYGEFSELEVQLFQQLVRKTDVVVEVGANIGAHTLPLAKIVGDQGRVYAFEPQRIIFQTLCANLALNSITNAECFQVAAASEDGFIQIPDILYNQEGNFGGVSVNRFEQGINVPKVKLDNFLKLSNLRLLKVDVEGMEAEVLQGAQAIINQCKPILYVENDRPDQSAALINLLFSMGYKLFWHLPPMYNPQNWAAESTNIFQGTISINMLGFHKTQRINIKGLKEVKEPNFYPLKK